MAILTELDKAVYFPDVTLTGAALNGLLLRVQAFVESYHGCGRLIEPTIYVENLQIPTRDWQTPYTQRTSSTLFLRHSPVMVQVCPVVEVRNDHNRMDGFSRLLANQWVQLGTDSFELDLAGRLRIYVRATEARVTYQSGIDFDCADDPAVQEIKAIAGMLASHLFLRRPGIDTSLTDEPGATAERLTFAPLDEYMKTILMPLKKYYPVQGC